jgi:hypothetical protein
MGRLTAGLLRAWCGLTRQEQQALVAVLALLLLGAAARWWRQVERERQMPHAAAMKERTVR